MSEDNKTRLATFNDVEYLAQCHDPYGFWTIAPVIPVSNLPEAMQGHFTSADRAFQAAQAVPEGSLIPKKREEKVLTAKVR